MDLPANDPKATRPGDSGPSAGDKSEIAELRSEFLRLEEKIKARETNIFLAVRTLLEDLVNFYQGKGPFPTHALIGATLAYLRPRIVLVVGGIFATIFAGIQVALLWNQNNLIAQQNIFLKAQMEAEQLQAVSFLVSSIDPSNPAKNQIAIAQLSQYGAHGFDALIRLVDARDGKVSLSSLEALFGQHHLHTPQQVVKTLTVWSYLFSELEGNQMWGLLDVDFEMAKSFDDNYRTITQEYFSGLTERIGANKKFRGELYDLIKKEPNFISGLAWMYYAFLKHGRKLAPEEDDIHLDSWHEVVYVFCRTLAGWTVETHEYRDVWEKLELREPSHESARTKLEGTIKEWLGLTEVKNAAALKRSN